MSAFMTEAEAAAEASSWLSCRNKSLPTSLAVILYVRAAWITRLAPLCQSALGCQSVTRLPSHRVNAARPSHRSARHRHVNVGPSDRAIAVRIVRYGVKASGL